MTKHDLSGHRLYRTYHGIVQRCTNPKNNNYQNYGGRGIRCLFTSAEEFVRWALKNGWEPWLSCDRKNNDGPYSKFNCRFVDRLTQARNTSRNRLVTINGETYPLVVWAELRGIKYRTVGTRLHRGQTVEQALGLAP